MVDGAVAVRVVTLVETTIVTRLVETTIVMILVVTTIVMRVVVTTTAMTRHILVIVLTVLLESTLLPSRTSRKNPSNITASLLTSSRYVNQTNNT